ncbi:hypothetical protein NLI96_g2462 [Meripilus lineatus]|uniref:Nudix hydrolase domain-containing protein n=1 Tax=Meripilus lineatus TaxID=2056292 RepID=A0AAD5V8Q9_9APHY|nr:hypothetical protein NLI96_g2462 [Physisporinus lineatus]
MSTSSPPQVAKQPRPPPSKPRPSASLIIINPQNEILLVQRNPRAGTFAGAYVFPGGNFDPNQDDSLEITAIRETFEETGLLLASADPSAECLSSQAPSDEELNIAREEIHSQRQLFKNFLRRHNLIPDTSSLLPFTQWVTPPIQPNWTTPEQREKVQQLSSGLFGKMTINPRALPGKDARGRTTLTYEGDETRGGSPGRLHRVIVNITKGGGMSVDELLRNFDIFNGIEAPRICETIKALMITKHSWADGGMP